MSQITADYILTIDNQSSVDLKGYLSRIGGGSPDILHQPAKDIAAGRSDYMAWDTLDGKIPKTRTFVELWFYVDGEKQPPTVCAVGMYGYDTNGTPPCTTYLLGVGTRPWSSHAVGQNTITDEKEIAADEPANNDPWIESGLTREQTYEYVLPMPAGKVKVIVANDPREGPLYSVLVTFKDYSD